MREQRCGVPVMVIRLCAGAICAFIFVVGAVFAMNYVALQFGAFAGLAAYLTMIVAVGFTAHGICSSLAAP